MLTYTATRNRYAQRADGLYDAASPLVTHNDDKWARGNVAQVDWCDVRAHLWPLSCRDDSPPDGTYPDEKVIDGPGITEGEPVTVYFRPECTIAGDNGEVAKAGEEVLGATEQTAVERLLWRNLLSVTGDCAPLLTTDNVGCALGAVEQSLSWRYPGTGVIHAPMWTAALFTNLGVVRKREGGGLETHLGTRLVFGTGYFGTPGDGADIAGFHIVGTGAVRIDRGPIFEQNGYDHLRNTSQGLVERNVAVTFGCVCVSAAVTTTCEPPAGAMPDYDTN